MTAYNANKNRKRLLKFRMNAIVFRQIPKECAEFHSFSKAKHRPRKIKIIPPLYSIAILASSCFRILSHIRGEINRHRKAAGH